MVIKIRNDRESLQRYLTYFYWAFSLLIRRVTATLMTILGLLRYVEVLNGLLWFSVFLLCIKVFFAKIKWSDLFLLLALFIFSYFSIWMWPFNYFVNENRLHYFTKVFPYFYIGKCLTSDKTTIRGMRIISIAVIILNYAVYFLYYMRGGGSGIFDDNLAFAYDLLPHVVLLFYVAYIHKTFKNVAFFLFSVLLLVMQGTRGPLLFLVVFYGWCFFSTQSIKKQILKTIIIVLVLSVFLYSGMLEKTIVLFINIGKEIGVSTRVLETIIERAGTGLRSNFWREYLFGIAINGIKIKPFMGYGPYGDYYLTRFDPYFIGGTYIHNIAVELVIDYGIPLGLFCFIYICFILLNAYFCKPDRIMRLFLILLISSGLFKLFFSSSYLYEPIFYVLMGYAFSLLEEKKRIT